MAEPLREFTRFIWWMRGLERGQAAADGRPNTKPDDLRPVYSDTTQLNSTSSWVELSCVGVAIDTSPTQLNSIQLDVELSWIELSCVAINGPLGCESACANCQSLHPPSPFINITHPESWYSFYRPTEGRRLSRPSWLVTYRDGLPAHRWSLILVLI